jgi:predicted amidohydrolase
VKLALVNAALSALTPLDNVRRIRELLEPLRGGLGEADLALLPEHLHFGSWPEYLEAMRELAAWLGCHLVAGSAHHAQDTGTRNAGVVLAPSGKIVARYEKLRPYADERSRIEPGQQLGSFEHGGRRVSVMICADFWFTDLFLAQPALPDLVLVPALSVTRKLEPDYSQTLWRHTAVARAFEFGVYVGISDWSAAAELPLLRTSGVSGFADPTPSDPSQLFRKVDHAAVFNLDFAALDALRADRRARGFFWESSHTVPPGA